VNDHARKGTFKPKSLSVVSPREVKMGIYLASESEDYCRRYLLHEPKYDSRQQLIAFRLFFYQMTDRDQVASFAQIILGRISFDWNPHRSIFTSSTTSGQRERKLRAIYADEFLYNQQLGRFKPIRIVFDRPFEVSKDSKR
jgi:hypothetical protein